MSTELETVLYLEKKTRKEIVRHWWEEDWGGEDNETDRQTDIYYIPNHHKIHIDTDFDFDIDLDIDVEMNEILFSCFHDLISACILLMLCPLLW